MELSLLQKFDHAARVFAACDTLPGPPRQLNHPRAIDWRIKKERPETGALL
jgi:hypothetical protein